VFAVPLEDDGLPLRRISQCPICSGMGFVCEDHRDKPFEHDGCNGAGSPCKGCNPQGVEDWAYVTGDNRLPPEGEPRQ
jgi:hypothetical protein